MIGARPAGTAAKHLTSLVSEGFAVVRRRRGARSARARALFSRR